MDEYKPALDGDTLSSQHLLDGFLNKRVAVCGSFQVFGDLFSGIYSSHYALLQSVSVHYHILVELADRYVKRLDAFKHLLSRLGVNRFFEDFDLHRLKAERYIFRLVDNLLP